jgi:hypothetical protein
MISKLPSTTPEFRDALLIILSCSCTARLKKYYIEGEEGARIHEERKNVTVPAFLRKMAYAILVPSVITKAFRRLGIDEL